MFNKNSVGEKINNILIKNNVKFENGISFEDAVKKSDHFEKILNLPSRLGQKSVVTNLHTNERNEIDCWISFMFYFKNLFNKDIKKINQNEMTIISYIFDAVRYENEKDYHKFFESEDIALKTKLFDLKTQEYRDIVDSCFTNFYYMPIELRLTKYNSFFNSSPDNFYSDEPLIEFPENFTKNDWINLKNMLDEDVNHIKENILHIQDVDTIKKITKAV